MLSDKVRELRIIESLRGIPLIGYEDFFYARWELEKAIRRDFEEECIPPDYLIHIRLRINECGR